jgi:group I intron endonuclease
MKSGIYRIINLVNEKCYIGSAVNLSDRKSQHFSGLKKNRHGNKHLQSSFTKYGEENFIFDIIEFCEKEKLIEKEQFWINSYKAKGEILYNICPIAGNMLGYKFTEEQKKKLSESHKGQVSWNKGKKLNLSDEQRKVMSDRMKERTPYNKGQHHSEEHRQKLSKAWETRNPPSEETKAKIGIGNKGKIVSKETREKLSKVNKGRPLTEEHKQKLSEVHKGKTPWNKGLVTKTPIIYKFTEEQRKRMSDAHKGKPVWNQKLKLVEVAS